MYKISMYKARKSRQANEAYVKDFREVKYTYIKKRDLSLEVKTAPEWSELFNYFLWLTWNRHQFC